MLTIRPTRRRTPWRPLRRRQQRQPPHIAPTANSSSSSRHSCRQWPLHITSTPQAWAALEEEEGQEEHLLGQCLVSRLAPVRRWSTRRSPSWASPHTPY